MHAKMLELKLRAMVRRHGEMTYDECVELAKYSETVLKDLNCMDPAWRKFNEDRDQYWKYADLLDERDTLQRLEHYEDRQYLVTWWEYSPYVKPKQRTEQVMVRVPKYVRSHHERRSLIDQALVDQFGTTLSPIHQTEIYEIQEDGTTQHLVELF